MRRVGRTVAQVGKGLMLCAALGMVFPALGANDPSYLDAKALMKGPLSPAYKVSAGVVDQENRTHDVGQLWLTITNWGFFGNQGPGQPGAVDDPCTNEWAVQAEYPGGSGVEYLYRAGLWIGAMIQEEGFEYPRVSTGTEGWRGSEEFNPVTPIVERSTRSAQYNCLGDFVSSPDAVSEQDFVTSYADTATTTSGGTAITDPIDGPHQPLGLKVTQKSYAWSYNYAQDFIIIDYEIENIADNYLKNLYIGLYVDADVGLASNLNHHTDDICGFSKDYVYNPPGTEAEPETLTINTAWIADNDGRPYNVSSGNQFTCPDVTGTRVVRAPNPRLRTSFNWWISNSDPDFDFGPAWQDDNSIGDWTRTLGTPEGDARKYFILGNREFDYDQVYTDKEQYIQSNPQVIKDRFTGEVLSTHPWRPVDASNPTDLANGFDTRYLISWGPLGIFDFIDDAGNRVYRLNPGEKFSMTIAYVAGAGFHDRNNPQTNNTEIDPSKFNFADFQYNADWAAKVYDNPMLDTPDPVTGRRDGWFGEDVGLDCVYAANPGDTVRFVDQFTKEEFVRVYNGPDEGERDGRLQRVEDLAPRPNSVDYTYNNELFDQGDGVPDFQGPPPPPTPVVTYRTEGENVILVWHKNPSEDPEYRDPFSREQDFEGYRIYMSTTGAENQFTFLAEYDATDWSYFSDSDSLLDSTYYDISGLPQTKDFGGITGHLKPIGLNTGLDNTNPAADFHMANDSTYEYVIRNAHPMVPVYYAVTAYDYGDYRSGTESLESAKSANMSYIAPAGTPLKKPGVVPNPYRANENYTRRYMQLMYGTDDTAYVSWENRDDGTPGYFPQTDRRIYFYNLPKKCLIRIMTVSGDLVQIIEHDPSKTSRITKWRSDHAEAWDLNSRNQQQVVSGLYFFSVEDRTPENKGHIDVGKFVIIR